MKEDSNLNFVEANPDEFFHPQCPVCRDNDSGPWIPDYNYLCESCAVRIFRHYKSTWMEKAKRWLSIFYLERSDVDKYLGISDNRVEIEDLLGWHDGY